MFKYEPNEKSVWIAKHDLSNSNTAYILGWGDVILSTKVPKNLAHLLAAAPDLLEVLKTTLPYLYKMKADNVDTVIPVKNIIDIAEKAITKAEGKAS